RLEIGVHRKIGGGGDFGKVRKHGVAAHRGFVVGQAAREGETGAGSGQRAKAEMAQIPRATDVPRVRDYEAAALVQFAKGRAGSSEVRGHSSTVSPQAPGRPIAICNSQVNTKKLTLKIQHIRTSAQTVATDATLTLG